MSYLDWGGSGAAIHFAHANGFNAQTYTSLLAPLASEFHVLACDQRGHGFSTLSAVQGLAKDWAIFRDDLVALLAQIGSDPVILAGHSMGATASLMAAAAAPERVRALVLFEPVLVGSPAPAETNPGPDLAMRAAMRRNLFPSLEAAFESYRGRGIFKNWSEAMLGDYLCGGLVPAEGGGMKLACAPAWEAECFRETPLGAASVARNVTCSITIVHGTIGSTSFGQELAEIAQFQPGTRITRIDGANHFLPMEYPEIVAEECRAVARQMRTMSEKQ